MLVFTPLFFISQEHWNENLTTVFRNFALAGFVGAFVSMGLLILPPHWYLKKREETICLHKKHFTWKGKEYAYRDVKSARWSIQDWDQWRYMPTLVIRLEGPRWVFIRTLDYKDCEKEFKKPLKQLVSRLAAQNNRAKRELPTWSLYLWGICFIVFILLLLFDLVSAILGLA